MRDHIKLFKKYLRWLRGVTFYLIFNFIVDSAISLKALFIPLLVKITFDYVYPYRDFHLLNVVTLTTIILYFIEFYFSVVADYADIYVDQTISYKMVSSLFLKIQRIPLKFHKKFKIGDMLVRLTEDIDTVINQITSLIPSLLINAFKIIALLVITLSINSKITLLALASIPLYIIETNFFSKKLARVEREKIDTNSKIYDNFQEKLRNIKTIKSFSKEIKETNYIQSHLRQRFNLTLKEKVLTVLSVFSNSMTLKMWTILINWYMAYLVINESLTIGELVALNTYLLSLSEPITSLSDNFTSFKVSMVSFSRLEEIFNLKEEDLNSGTFLENVENGIKFKNVSFSYDEDTRVLREITTDINNSGLIAIVGESGSGKSTLMDLLLRFHDSTGGVIFINNKNIKEYNLLSLRNSIGLVLQDYSLFSGTVRENISYGFDRPPSDDELLKALKLSGAYQFVQRLKGGLDFDIGASGTNLSGGQRQRIAIARVILKNPKIIILDEATSALDPESDYHIQESLNFLRRDKIIFMISHNLSTIKKADRVAYLEEGKIIESGSFDELLNRKGAFYKFYLRQFGGFQNFKKRLDIEFECVRRYQRPLNLIAMRINDYQKLLKLHDYEFIEALMDHIDLKIQSFVRIMDFASRFEDNLFLIALPEISQEQAAQFIGRFTNYFKSELQRIKEENSIMCDLSFSVACLHYNNPCRMISDDLMEQAIKKLQGVNNWEYKLEVVA